VKSLVLARVRNIVNRLHKARLVAAQGQIVDTPPLEMKAARLRFVSMVSHRDVSSYLCAIKSLYIPFGEGQVTIISDGSLTGPDRSKIAQHLPLCDFIELTDIDVGDCPRGGTWERLVCILRLSMDNYVIQVDSDTLTTGPIPEVITAYRNNAPFLLGTDLGQSFGTLEAVATLVAGFPVNRDKIGCVAEMALPNLPNSAQLSYARGSSGFAGFAKGAFKFEELEEFSQRMQHRLGNRWSEWGSEQVASNFVIANSAGALVLPYRFYACFEPSIDASTRRFLHFYGTYRFDRGFYRKQALAFIARQRSNAP
jgi:hypothetical protein